MFNITLNDESGKVVYTIYSTADGAAAYRAAFLMCSMTHFQQSLSGLHTQSPGENQMAGTPENQSEAEPAR
jgi:hypothetical protein